MARCRLLYDDNINIAALAKEAKRGDRVIALTLEAASKLTAAGFDYFAVNNIVPHARVCELAHKAQELMVRFAATSCKPELLDGIAWGTLLHEDGQLAFFRELVFAQELGRDLLSWGFDEYIWYGEASPPPHTPAFAMVRTLQGTLGSRFKSAHTLFLPSDFFHRVGRRVTSSLMRPVRPRNNGAAQHSKYVAIFSTTQWERFTEPLCNLRGSGHDIAVWYLGEIPRKLQAWAEAKAMPLYSVPYPITLDSDIKLYFGEQYGRWQEARRFQLADEFDLQALELPGLEPHFEQVFQYTLAHAAQWGRSLYADLLHARPALVLGTAAFTYMTALADAVARKAQITTLALSHTFVSRDYGIVPTDFLTCHNRFEREHFRHAFPRDERVVFCKDFSNTLSYVATTESRALNSHTVAVLTAAPTENKTAMSTVDVEPFLTTFAELAEPPQDLKVALVFKSHPRFDISKLVPVPLQQIWSANASVHDLLAQAWVIVLCNHYGGVFVEAMMTGKPVILLDSAGYCFPFLEQRGKEACRVVSDASELWGVLRELYESEKVYAELAEQSKNFRDWYLTGSEMTLANVIDELHLRGTTVGQTDTHTL